MQKELILREFNDLLNCVTLLKHSVHKYVPYHAGKIYTPDEMEYYDSFSFRFEKTVELFLNFFRALEVFLYSKNSDTLRDLLLKMEKLKFINSIDEWMGARLLRNKIAHAYLPDQLKELYEEAYRTSSVFFSSLEKIEAYITKEINLNG